MRSALRANDYLDGWGLLRPEGDTDWLDARGADAEMVLAAFERFFATRPDRRATKAQEHQVLLRACEGILAFERAAKPSPKN